jgi:hypothetical protein
MRPPSPVGSRRNLVSTPEGRPQLGRAVCKLSVLGEAEAGSAGTQPCRGIAWWAHRYDENGARSSDFAPRLQSHRTIDPHALENPGGLGAGPQSKKSPQYLVVFLWCCVFEVERWRGRNSSKVPHATDRRDGRSSSIRILSSKMLRVSRASQLRKKKSPRLQPEA